MFGLRLLSSMLVVGTLIVPGHWCCLVDLGTQPCCHAASTKVEPAPRSCCQNATKHDSALATPSVQSIDAQVTGATPEPTACCCDTGDRTAPTPTRTDVSLDVPVFFSAAPFVAPPTATCFEYIGPSYWPPAERLQARLCVWRC